IRTIGAAVAILVGVVLALGFGLLATRTGLDRARFLYPAVMAVIAVLYAGFAIAGGSVHALALESIGAIVFLLASIAGFRWSLWIIVAALIGHGLFDLVHPTLISNPGVPVWWPGFCGAYDVAAGLYLAWLLSTNRIRNWHTVTS
ncbi:MAG: hypothetical protein ABJC74_09655, partial [Gemmatimonadota bacterium]